MINCAIVLFMSLALVIAPNQLNYEAASMAEFGRVAGSLIAALAVLALWEVLAPLLWACAFGGLVVILAPLFMRTSGGQIDASAAIVHLICGLIILAVGFVGRTRKRRYGGGWRSVLRDDSSFEKITWS